MNGPTHLLGGLAAGTAIAAFAPAGSLLPIAGVALAGVAALAPDRIQYTIRSARFPLEGHRGISHTLIFVAVTSLCFRVDLAPYWCAGLLSHLLLDVITIAGIPLLWPLRARRVSLSLTTNGSASEAVLRALLVVFVALMWLRPLLARL